MWVGVVWTKALEFRRFRLCIFCLPIALNACVIGHVDFFRVFPLFSHRTPSHREMGQRLPSSKMRRAWTKRCGISVLVEFHSIHRINVS